MYGVTMSIIMIIKDVETRRNHKKQGKRKGLLRSPDSQGDMYIDFRSLTWRDYLTDRNSSDLKMWKPGEIIRNKESGKAYFVVQIHRGICTLIFDPSLGGTILPIGILQI